MDLAVFDEKYSNLTKHKRKKPLGNPVSFIGTREEVLNKINELTLKLIDLSTKIYVEGEENVTLNKV